MKTHDLSIVIPCRNTDTLIDQVLQSLGTQKDCHYEVILVINPPSDKNLKTNLDNVRVTSSPRGANHARNQGLMQATSDLVLFLDSDCTLQDPYFLKKYVDFMQAHQNLTGCGGPYLLPSPASSASKTYHKIQMQWLYDGFIDKSLKTKHLLGGNLVLRKSKLGLEKFDEKIIFGGTEQEFLYRLSMKNHQFQFLSQQSVIHIAKVSFFDFCLKAFKQGQGYLYRINKLNIKSEPKTVLDLKRTYEISSSTYRLFFQIGSQQFFKNQCQLLKHSLIYFYHRSYNYLNLIKRSE